MTTLVRWWGLIWPNLAASILWTWPVLAWHHWRIRRHITTAVDRAAHTDQEPG